MDTKLKLILLLALLLINPVSAKFICGEVTPSGQLYPSWYEAKTFLSTSENNFSTCLVSPSNNRYCCDLDIIKDKTGYSWKSGDVFISQITDPASGYFTPPKNITLTGEGYDVAPILSLEKAIQITFPNTTLTISESPIQIQSKIANTCTNTTISQTNATLGKNNISITTTCNNKQFKLKKTFFVVQNITPQNQYSREFGKEKNNPRIRNKKTGKINLIGNISSSVEEISLKEYVPASWQIKDISSNGTLQESTSEYNVIMWQINGNKFNFSYHAKAPSVGIRPELFTFKTQIDQYDLDESTIEVYKLFPFPFEKKVGHRRYSYIPKTLAKVSPELPLIYEDENITAALYSTRPLEQDSFNLLDFLSDAKFDRGFDYLKSYQIQTTLNSTERGKMIFEYDVNKTFLKENNYKEIGFFERNKDKFLKITGAVIASDKDSLKYRFETKSSPSEIFILAEKNKTNIWSKLLNLWNKIKFWQNI